MRTRTIHSFLTCALLIMTIGVPFDLALAESGSFSDCLIGCIPGVNPCTDCCRDTFQSQFPTACYDTYVDCTKKCESLNGTKAVACFKYCQSDLKACHDEYDRDIKEFHCPDWMEPKDCPFECQTWSPISRKCVGAPKEVCD